MDCYTDEKRRELAAKRRELNKIKKRIAEIDDLILKIYEDNVSQKIPDERFEMFSKRYETEQQELKAKIPELEAYLTTETDKKEAWNNQTSYSGPTGTQKLRFYTARAFRAHRSSLKTVHWTVFLTLRPSSGFESLL